MVALLATLLTESLFLQAVETRRGQRKVGHYKNLSKSLRGAPKPKPQKWVYDLGFRV